MPGCRTAWAKPAKGQVITTQADKLKGATLKARAIPMAMAPVGMTTADMMLAGTMQVGTMQVGTMQVGTMQVGTMAAKAGVTRARATDQMVVTTTDHRRIQQMPVPRSAWYGLARPTAWGAKCHVFPTGETMTRAGSILVLSLMLAGAAWGGPVEDSVTSQLKAYGYTDIKVSRTLLGRSRIVAQSPKASREIVINPFSGEILRDITTATDGHLFPNRDRGSQISDDAGEMESGGEDHARGGAEGQGEHGGDDGQGGDGDD